MPLPADLSRRDLIKTAGLSAAGAALLNQAAAPQQARAQAPAPAAAPDPAPGFALWAQPVLQHLRPTHAHVLVTTTRPSVAHIDLAPAAPGDAAPGADDDASTRRCTATVHGQVQAQTQQHLITLDDLTPGTTYTYRVTATEIKELHPYSAKFGDTVETAQFSFKTPAILGSSDRVQDNTVQFSVLNDIHQRLDLYAAFMAQIADERCDLLALNGDMLNDPMDLAQVVDNVFAPLGGQGTAMPLEFVRGNHETRGAYSRQFGDALAMPHDNYYYTFRQGPVQFVVMDTGEDKPDEQKEYFGLAAFDPYHQRQTRWLERVLASDAWKTAPFRVVLAHIPVRRVTEGRLWNISREHQHNWMKMLANSGLDLMLCGHTHRYEVVEKAPEPGYLMIIGGGPRPGSATRIAVHADARRMTATVTDDAGQTLDTLHYDRQG